MRSVSDNGHFRFEKDHKLALFLQWHIDQTSVRHLDQVDELRNPLSASVGFLLPASNVGTVLLELDQLLLKRGYGLSHTFLGFLLRHLLILCGDLLGGHTDSDIHSLPLGGDLLIQVCDPFGEVYATSRANPNPVICHLLELLQVPEQRLHLIPRLFLDRLRSQIRTVASRAAHV
ncbi:hypothetical protein LXH09_28395 [Streptomyces sp. CS7]|nr:hypothetical protein [Streptomyces sp. CS-7]MCT6780569.1 hypothetical protein [Streptomyces sp. CS-7]